MKDASVNFVFEKFMPGEEENHEHQRRPNSINHTQSIRRPQLEVKHRPFANNIAGFERSASMVLDIIF